MGASDLEARVRRLCDLEAIRDLARRYAHCVWQGDVEGAVALFCEDGEMDTGDRPPLRGRAALREAYRGMLDGARFQPFVHNHVIELDGEAARGTVYLDLRSADGGESLIGAGWYDDRYAREDGVWRFRSRRLRLSFLVPLRDGWA